MIQSLAPDVQNIATLIVLLSPGFVFISVYESINIAAARARSAWEWTMRSLVLSLPLFALFSGLYDLFDWSNEPTDASFYLGLFGGALVSGYVAGGIASNRIVRRLFRRVGVNDPQRTWVDVVGHPDSYVVVHLLDGTVLYGYPSSFTDDPRDPVREIFLTDAAILRQKDEKDPGAWEAFGGTEGVLIESPQIRLIQLVSQMDQDSETESGD